MELISKVSKGSRMDQIYIPKRRMGFDVGTHVAIRPLQESEKINKEKPFFYHIDYLEPIKLKIVNEIFGVVDKLVNRYDNIIITGSFLDEGFNFNDIDLILVSEDRINKKYLEELLKKKTGIKVHIILMDNNTLTKGLNSDPLYQTMLSKCVSRRRFVYRIKPKINYKILDLHLLKSKLLIENFSLLTGDQKYELVRNAVSIALFIDHQKVSKDKVDQRIDRWFGKDMTKKLKANTIPDKRAFLEKYKKFYKDLSSKILSRIKDGSKQK